MTTLSAYAATAEGTPSGPVWEPDFSSDTTITTSTEQFHSGTRSWKMTMLYSYSGAHLYLRSDGDPFPTDGYITGWIYHTKGSNVRFNFGGALRPSGSTTDFGWTTVTNTWTYFSSIIYAGSYGIAISAQKNNVTVYVDDLTFHSFDVMESKQPSWDCGGSLVGPQAPEFTLSELLTEYLRTSDVPWDGNGVWGNGSTTDGISLGITPHTGTMCAYIWPTSGTTSFTSYTLLTVSGTIEWLYSGWFYQNTGSPQIVLPYVWSSSSYFETSVTVPNNEWTYFSFTGTSPVSEIGVYTNTYPTGQYFFFDDMSFSQVIRPPVGTTPSWDNLPDTYTVHIWNGTSLEPAEVLGVWDADTKTIKPAFINVLGQ